MGGASWPHRGAPKTEPSSLQRQNPQRSNCGAGPSPAQSSADTTYHDREALQAAHGCDSGDMRGGLHPCGNSEQRD